MFRLIQLFIAVFITYAICLTSAYASELKTVRVGYYENESFQEGASTGSTRSGYSYEYLQKVASLAGWKYEYVYGSWQDLYDEFLKGSIDLLAGMGYSEKRKDLVNYPDFPMGEEAYYIYVRSDDQSINDSETSLEGKKIGALYGLMINIIRQWLDERKIHAEVISYKDVKDRDNAFKNGLIDAFIGENLSVKADASYIPFQKLSNVKMYLCVSKKRDDLLHDLNYALSVINSSEPYYISDLSKKYFNENAVSLRISDFENQWLESHHNTIRIGYMDDFLPYCSSDAFGNAEGMLVDVIEKGISNLHGNQKIEVDYVAYKSTDEMIKDLNDHKIDMLFPISNNIYFLENKDLFSSKDVITSSMNLVYMEPLDKAVTLPIAINKNNQIQYDYALSYLKDAEVIYYNSVEECLNAVISQKAGSAILSGLRSSILLKEGNFEKLQFIELPSPSVKSFAVCIHNIGVLSLINRLLGSLDKNDAITYTYKYVRHHIDYSIEEFVKRHMLLINLFVIAFVIAALGLFAYIRIKNSKQRMYYKYAYLDSLTGLLNRRAFEEYLDTNKKELPPDLCCVSLDLNGLKGVNDNFGHLAGDELITEAGRIVNSSFKQYGLVYRTGGDEFFAMLKCNKEQYKAAQQNMQQICKEWRGKYSSNMRISIGSAFAGEENSGLTIVDLCKIADKRMYEAKSAYYRLLIKK